ncbi:hypothetical protein [Thermococcus sp. Bubb.Bath]|uniref:hypothetical protein n=1 Tax=Thermococcus sp. Bubb.Bath TaxID=1638242 RepID=UPI00143C8EFE|nr:hypothetical protein [Thermococcus sp. Bubb.Bath]NJF25849.1 hypothetical protein [Thermococcus sp. Bubb.Bath]
MPSHKLHRKWAEQCGIDGEIAHEVDILIDDMRHHDAVKIMITNMIALEATVGLLRGENPEDVKRQLVTLSKFFPRDVRKYAENLFTPLDPPGLIVIREIYEKYGTEGLQAAVLHVVLDYIEQLYLRGYDEERIAEALNSGKRERIRYLLEEAGLEDCIYDHLDEILGDIKASKPPSKNLTKDLEQHREIVRALSENGVKAIVVEGKPYSPATGVRKVKSLLRKKGMIAVGLVYKDGVFRERTIGSLPTGIFHNEYIGDVSLSEIASWGMEIALKTGRGGRKTLYLYRKRWIKSLEELL